MLSLSIHRNGQQSHAIDEDVVENVHIRTNKQTSKTPLLLTPQIFPRQADNVILRPSKKTCQSFSKKKKWLVLKF